MLKPHSATGLIDRLERLGLIERTPSPTDRRRALLHLTGKAHAILAALSSAHRDQIRRSEEHTSELQSLMRISYAVFCLKKKKQIYTEKAHHEQITSKHTTS